MCCIRCCVGVSLEEDRKSIEMKEDEQSIFMIQKVVVLEEDENM